MIVNLLQRLFSSDCRKNLKEERQLRELSHVATVEKENAAISKAIRNETTTSTYEQDIIALEKHFSSLHEGMEIEIDLKTLLSICPRERRKSDAYKGLKSLLRKNGVILSIVNTPKNK